MRTLAHAGDLGASTICSAPTPIFGVAPAPGVTLNWVPAPYTPISRGRCPYAGAVTSLPRSRAGIRARAPARRELWHLAEVYAAAEHVRFWEENGHACSPHPMSANDPKRRPAGRRLGRIGMRVRHDYNSGLLSGTRSAKAGGVAICQTK
jgi:hypothetical protein